MALATETIILVSEDSSGGTSSKRSMGCLFLSLLIILLVFQIGGVAAVILYCLRTFYCGINEKHPHYNCEKSPDGLGQHGAMILELTFACSQVVSRAIFLCFGFKLLIKRGPIWREFFKPLCKLSQTWIILATLFLCVLRLVLILIDDDDLGEELSIAKTTNAMYVIDAFAMTTVLAILNFVKLRNLAKENVSNNKELCRVCGSRVTNKGVVFFLFKSVLASFFFQHFLYLMVVAVQLGFDALDVDKEFVGEDAQKAVILLKRSGQLTFMGLVSARLWVKLFDDNRCIVGTKTDEGRQTRQNSKSSISYDSMSVSDQSSFEELSLSSSSENYTASDSSFSEAMQTPQRYQSSFSSTSVNGSILHECQPLCELSSSSEYFTASDSSTHEAILTPQRPQSYLSSYSITINGQSPLAWTVV